LGIGKSATREEYGYTINIVPDVQDVQDGGSSDGHQISIMTGGKPAKVTAARKLHIDIPLGATYDGTLSANGQEIAGVIAFSIKTNFGWVGAGTDDNSLTAPPAPTEQGAPMPLTLKRCEAAACLPPNVQ
jgi:hypothetical protein